MKKTIRIFTSLFLILSILSACNNNTGFEDVPDIKLFYTAFNTECGLNEPCIYDVKSEEASIFTIENYDNIYLYGACGYSDGEFFSYYETADECKILKINNGKVVAVQDFEAKFQAPESWEYGFISILSMERYKNGVVFLSPNADVYNDEPFYADIPSTLYYTDFNGICEPILENIVSFKVYEDKISYCAFDEIKLAEYGDTTIYSRFNINVYENGETKELFSSENCPYESVEDWCSENELLLMKDGKIVKYNIETQEETVLLKPKFYYSFEKGNCIYVSDKYILAAAMKQNLLTLDSDVSYLYLFNVESGRRTLVSDNITGTYDAPFEIVYS